MAGSRHLDVGDARESIGSPRGIRPAQRDVSPRAGAAAGELANDLLARSVVSLAIAEHSLEVLRHSVKAIEITFWCVTDATAECLLRVGDQTLGQSLPVVALAERGNLGERLRRRAALICKAGEVTGVEDLVVAGANSYVLVSFLNDAGAAGVLVLGWDASEPPVDEASISHLQLAAGALLRTLFGERVAGSRVVAARVEERSRIGRELHDDLGQQTALLATKIDMLLRSSKASASKLRDGITEAKQNVQELAVTIHNLSHELHPPKLRLLGLVKTIESLCANVSKESGLDVTFRPPTVAFDVPEHISLCICRVAQEALQNAVKHSGARAVELSLSATGSDLTLRVKDSGRGFDRDRSSSRGIGLTTMRERVEEHGGRLSILASPGGGATIEATVPIGRYF